MDEALRSLPSSEELHKVFKDYKEVLKKYQYCTPLQRIHRMAKRQSSIALSQKEESQAEKVMSLLQPGAFTVYSIDLLKSAIAGEQDVFLRIPITLLQDGPRFLLLMNDEMGRISFQTFSDPDIALRSFKDEVCKCSPSRPYLPLYVHKPPQAASAFYSSFDYVAQAWKEQLGKEQRLQQFIQPNSKSASLLRAHWKKGKPGPTYYFLSRGVNKVKALPSLLSKIKAINRSFSEADIHNREISIKKSTSNLVVQTLKTMPDLNNPLETCAKLIQSSLKRGSKVTEMVCDFTSARTHRWVFLSCEGYTFAPGHKVATQIMQQNEVVDLRFLMYPLVANRFVLKQRLRWKNKMKNLAEQQHTEVVEMVESTTECSVVGLQKTNSLIKFPVGDPFADGPSPTRVRKKNVVRSLLNSDVIKYERLLLGSRQYKEEKNNKVDFLNKHGGEAAWEPHLTCFYEQFKEDGSVSEVFEENMGVEETRMVVCSFQRIIKGDFNFYYTEALRNIHQSLGISKSQYALFLGEIDPMLRTVTANSEDASKILHRFQMLEPYICSPQPKKG